MSDPPSLPDSEKRPSMPFSLLRLTAVLLFLGTTTLALCEYLGWPFLRLPAEAVLQDTLDRPVSITPPFRLSLLGGIHLTAAGLWIGPAPGFSEPALLDAHGLDLNLGYQGLKAYRDGGPMVIPSLSATQLNAWLVRHADGRSNWAQNRPSTPAASPTPLPLIEQLQISTGRLLLRDPGMQVDMAIRFATREGVTGAPPLSEMFAEGRFHHRAIKGYLRMSGLLPVVSVRAEHFLAAAGWLVYDRIRTDFDGKVSDLFGKRYVRGQVDVSGPSLAMLGELTGSALPTTGSFDIRAGINRLSPVWDVNVSTARIGRSRLSGNFRYDPRPPVSRLDGTLSGQNFVLADLAPTFGALTPDGEQVKPPPGRVMLDRPLDLSALHAMDADIAVDIAHVDLGKAFAQPIAPLNGRLQLSGGKLELSDIKASTARGTVTGAMSIDSRPARPEWRGMLDLDNIQLEDLLKLADSRAKGGAGKKPAPSALPYFSGILEGRIRMTGYGASMAAIAGTLNGEASFFVRQGSVSRLVVEAMGVDVAQGLSRLVFGDKALPVACAVMDFDAKNGILHPRNALVDTPVTVLLIDGAIDLNQEKLALRLVAKPKNLSPFTFRTPIHVEGPFIHPQVRLEKKPILLRILAAIVLGSINPAAALLPMVDFGDRQGIPTCRATLNPGR